jgi:N-formylglutamate deformylase
MQDATPNIVLHIPHSSRRVPADERRQLLLTDEELERELLAMTDAHTEALFHDTVPGAREIVFPVSRLVVDPERFVDDDAEPMSRVGMGVVYTRTSNGAPLRATPRTDEREALLKLYYEPHHSALTVATRKALARSGSCLVVDCHSFPSIPLPYELDQSGERPDICLGADEDHTPGPLVESLRHSFEAAGMKVFVNRPFSGSLVPGEHYRRDYRVSSVMIEVNRRLYMDEVTGLTSPGFGEIRDALGRALGSIALDA